MTLCHRLGAAALLLRAAPAKGKLPAVHVAALRGCADFRRSASTLVRHAPATACCTLRQTTAAGPTAALDATRLSSGGKGGWEGRSEGAGGDASAMWRLALASGAGLVLVVGQSSSKAQCQEDTDGLSEGELKIAKMSENKANGQQGAWMAKFEVLAPTPTLLPGARRLGPATGGQRSDMTRPCAAPGAGVRRQGGACDQLGGGCHRVHHPVHCQSLPGVCCSALNAPRVAPSSTAHARTHTRPHTHKTHTRWAKQSTSTCL